MFLHKSWPHFIGGDSAGLWCRNATHGVLGDFRIAGVPGGAPVVALLRCGLVGIFQVADRAEIGSIGLLWGGGGWSCATEEGR